MNSGTVSFSKLRGERADQFSIERISIAPTNTIENNRNLPFSPTNSGKESVEKKLKTENKLIFDIHLGPDSTITDMYLSGINLVPFSEFSVYGILEGHENLEHRAVSLINVKSEEIQKYIDYSFPESKKYAYRKMTGTGDAPENTKGVLYHPLYIPVKTAFFDNYVPYTGRVDPYTEHVVYKDVSTDNFIQWTKQYKELRVVFDFNDIIEASDLKLSLSVATNLPSQIGAVDLWPYQMK